MKTCEQCGKEDLRVVDVNGVAEAQGCGCRCSTCDGRGHVFQDVEQGGRRYSALAVCGVCADRKKRLRCFNAAGLPAVLGDATLESFEVSHTQQAHGLAVARAFVASAGKSKGFLVTGPVGTGKTHLLVATLRHLALDQQVQVRYLEMSFLFATIRRGFNEGRSGGEIIEPLAEVPVLAVDELGKGRGTPFEMETLEELIARRYNARRPTLFGSNYAFEEQRPAPRVSGLTLDVLAPARVVEEMLLGRVGPRTYSRLHEMCELVQFPMQGLTDRRRQVA